MKTMKSALLTFEAKKALGRSTTLGHSPTGEPGETLAVSRPRPKNAAGRDGGIVFAWSVIGFTSTLIMIGFAFFTYAFTHLP